MNNSKDDVPLSLNENNNDCAVESSNQSTSIDLTEVGQNELPKTDKASENTDVKQSSAGISNKVKSKPSDNIQSDSKKSDNIDKNKQNKNKKNSVTKKKKKVNLWPLKAMVITFFLSAAVNVASELALSDAQVWLTYGITVLIVLIGVFFDMIGTASTACDIQPFLAMASRKVKGAKTAVKLAKSSDAVSSVCNDIVGDICGIVSGVCAATIVSTQVNGSLWLSVLVYALISTATITLKAVGKGFAVKKANSIIFATAKVLSIFNKEG